ncbi:uncharacterized protein LOC120617494 [Pteropus medius]|uniref:uncharacterized protein LOC120617494 n=1 Tax=Pteropus vampyrus TaxID=132908 RepID=UPI00196A90D5|nr:uncharacterized protein LOC120617494 [Pteropus giganteus]
MRQLARDTQGNELSPSGKPRLGRRCDLYPGGQSKRLAALDVRTRTQRQGIRQSSGFRLSTCAGLRSAEDIGFWNARTDGPPLTEVTTCHLRSYGQLSKRPVTFYSDEQGSVVSLQRVDPFSWWSAALPEKIKPIRKIPTVLVEAAEGSAPPSVRENAERGGPTDSSPGSAGVKQDTQEMVVNKELKLRPEVRSCRSGKTFERGSPRLLAV